MHQLFASTDHAVALYAGHDSGARYLASHDIARLSGGAAMPVLLVGCSSGVLRDADGCFDAHGPALAHLARGAPAVLANLWDVTDKDIDALAETLLCGWLQGNGATLGSALAAARSACKLQYLNGAAPVVYGVPVAGPLQQ